MRLASASSSSRRTSCARRRRKTAPSVTASGPNQRLKVSRNRLKPSVSGLKTGCFQMCSPLFHTFSIGFGGQASYLRLLRSGHPSSCVTSCPLRPPSLKVDSVDVLVYSSQASSCPVWCIHARDVLCRPMSYLLVTCLLVLSTTGGRFVSEVEWGLNRALTLNLCLPGLYN